MPTTMTNRNRWQLFLGLVFAAGVATPGCSPFGASNAQNGALDEITATDATAGFRDFTAELIADDGSGSGSIDAEIVDLSDDVVVAIEDLQFDFNRGLISDSQFGTGVQDVIGDDASTFAFAGFDMAGGPFRFERTSRLTELLGLTDEQAAATDVILNDLHNAIAALRDELENSIDAVMTDAQKVAVRRRARSGSGHPGFFGRRLGPEQALTDAQSASITPMRRELRRAVRALHVEAREAFRDLLTEEQLRILDNFERAEIADIDDLGSVVD